VAIDDLPLPVVSFLNVIGVPWPYVNEDTVMQFASLVREFRQAVQTTHQDATGAVAAIARAHESVSTEAMQSGWAKSGATAGTPAGYALHPAAVRAQTQLLRGYASALRAHGAAFQEGVRGLSF